MRSAQIGSECVWIDFGSRDWSLEKCSPSAIMRLRCVHDLMHTASDVNDIELPGAILGESDDG